MQGKYEVKSLSTSVTCASVGRVPLNWLGQADPDGYQQSGEYTFEIC